MDCQCPRAHYEIIHAKNRRDFGKAALAASTLRAKPNSKFGGVQIGAITYSFRSLPGSGPELLQFCAEPGISSVELIGDAANCPASSRQDSDGRISITGLR